MVEAVTAGPRLELFARAPRQGWDVWGTRSSQTWALRCGDEDAFGAVVDAYGAAMHRSR
jgi:hypothetical protein